MRHRGALISKRTGKEKSTDGERIRRIFPHKKKKQRNEVEHAGTGAAYEVALSSEETGQLTHTLARIKKRKELARSREDCWPRGKCFATCLMMNLPRCPSQGVAAAATMFASVAVADTAAVAAATRLLFSLSFCSHFSSSHVRALP